MGVRLGLFDAATGPLTWPRRRASLLSSIGALTSLMTWLRGSGDGTLPRSAETAYQAAVDFAAAKCKWTQIARPSVNCRRAWIAKIAKADRNQGHANDSKDNKKRHARVEVGIEQAHRSGDDENGGDSQNDKANQLMHKDIHPVGKLRCTCGCEHTPVILCQRLTAGN